MLVFYVALGFLGELLAISVSQMHEGVHCVGVGEDAPQEEGLPLGNSCHCQTAFTVK